MINPLPLVLPLLAGMLVFSAAHTVPPELQRKAAGKSPLAATKMVLARGAGSTCRWGCNQPDLPCHSIDGPDDTVIAHEKQVWWPHFECGFAIGADTCTPLPDAICNIVIQYGPDNWTCMDPPTQTWTTTSSTCAVPSGGD